MGTGVGGGIVIDGKIFEGGYSGGAELGHIKNGSEGKNVLAEDMTALRLTHLQRH